MCPDFPKSGASAADVWSAATRKLTGLDGQPRTDLLGEDADFETGTGTRKARIDAAISTRAPEHEYDTEMAHIDTDVSSRAAPADILANPANKVDGLRIDNSLVADTPTEASVLMDGSVQTLVEITDVKVAEVEAWLDLTPMEAGDTIVITYSRKVKAAGTYTIYAQETYSDVQTLPLIKLIGAKIYRDIKISAQQTNVAYKTLDIQAIRTVTV